MLAGTVIDLVDGTTSFRVEAERRLGDAWKLGLELQFVAHAAADNLLATLDQDGFIVLRLSWFY